MRERWDLSRIGEVSEVIPGQSPKSKFYNTDRVGLPFYQGKKRFTDRCIDTPVKWTTDVTKVAERDDILMSVRAPVGPVNFATEKICIGRGLAAIRAHDSVDKEFLFYFFRKNEADLDSTKGAVFDSINSNQIKNIEIPIPPLPEQKRIVAILNEAFEALDRAKANIEKNIQNAEELFQSKLDEIFSQKGEGWEERSLGTVCELISGQHIISKNYNTKGVGIGYLTGPSDFGEVHPKVTKWTEFPKRTAEKNDILITVKGSGVGSINILDTDEVAISRQLMAVRAKKVNTRFIHSFLSLKYDYFQELSNGAAIPGISRSDVLNLSLFIPCREEQERIVKIIGGIESRKVSLKLKYYKKITLLEELKKSLLQKAFSGELTANESMVA